MKKLFALLMIFAMALSFSACARIENLKDVALPPLPEISEEAESTPVPTATPVPTLLPVPQSVQETTNPKLANHVIVGVSSTRQEFFDPQNGTELILSFGYDTPIVYIEGNDAASAAINEYIAALDETYNTGNDYGVGTALGLNAMLEMATDHYGYVINSGLEGELGFELSAQRSAYITRADSDVISLVFHSYEYTGGAHGVYTECGYNFDTETGALLGLEDLSEDTEALKAHLADCMIKLYENDETGYYSECMPEGYIEDGDYASAIRAVIREGSWCLDQNGIIFFSDLYELGPYSSGITEFHVSYADIKSYIDEKWLPDEKTGEGEIKLLMLSEVEDGSAEIIDRVVVNDEGQQICLSAEGVIYDVKLSKVAYSDRFYETDQLWACSYMNDCMLQISTHIPEGMPELMVSYTDGDGIYHRLLITQSGVDGSLILAGDDIEAVG